MRSLLVAAFACAIALGSLAALTGDRIADNRRRQAERALLLTVPAATAVRRIDGQVYALVTGTELSGFLVAGIASEGYNGDIHFWLGVSPDMRVLGVRVYRHRETPGIGDGIEQDVSPFTRAFENHDLAGTRWAVRRDHGDFDAMAGATITSRAMVNGVRDTLVSATAHRDRWRAAWDARQQTAAPE